MSKKATGTEGSSKEAGDPVLQQKQQDASASTDADASVDTQPEQDDKARIAELEDQIRHTENEHKDQLLRVAADKENTIKRMQNDTARLVSMSKNEIARHMFEIADNLERALEAKGNNPKAVIEGVALTLDQLRSAFDSLGMQVIDPKPGDPQNHNLHQAVMAEESSSHKAGRVLRVLQKGYKIDAAGVVLREAKVVVSKDPVPDSVNIESEIPTN